MITLLVVLAALVEPALGVLGSTRWRRRVVLMGGFAFAASLLAGADATLDVFGGFLAVYLVNAGRMTAGQAALAASLWTAFGLVGDLLFVYFVEHIDGIGFLRVSAAITSILLPAFLIAPWLGAKIVLVATISLLNAGRHALPQARVYEALVDCSGAALIADDDALLGAVVPVGLGVAARTFGLHWAMWLILVGPLVLLLRLPRREARKESTQRRTDR